MEVRKGMYSLPQADILARQLLEKRLNKKGYIESPLSPGYWMHKWHSISFMFCIDDFGVQYVGKQHTKHTMFVLRELYTILHDWNGKRYLGIDLDWEYAYIIVGIA